VKRQIQTLPPQQSNIKQRFTPEQLPLSELSQFISGKFTLDVPVYTVWGACEDVRVLERFRSGEYKVPNLHIIDEASSRLLDIGGIKLRLLGLGGAVVMHKLFDNGEGRTTIAGGQGTMWTTLLQMGELVDTANRVYDPTETRVFVTHASPAREGLLNQLSVTLKADFSISAGLHFRYGSSYNEFSVNPTLDHYRGKLAASKASFNDVWETVKGEVQPAVDSNEAQKTLLQNALDIVEKMPSVANGGNPFGGSASGQGAAGQVDESAFKNMWNFNLADAAFGYLVLEVESGRIGTEMRAQGFNFAHRGTGGKQAPAQQAPTNNTNPPTGPQAQARPNATPSSGPPAQPPRPQASQTPSQQQQKPIAQPARTNASPSPAVPAQVKPATPQPTGTPNVSMPGQDKSAASAAANGASTSEKTTTPAKPPSPVAEKKPSTGWFVFNLENEEEVRALVPEADKANIVRVEKVGRNFAVHFGSNENAKAAMEHLPAENKRTGQRPQPGQPAKPFVRYLEDRTPRQFSRGEGQFARGERDNQNQGGAGTWQASTRGGANVGGRGGYQSGQSDSEGGRGRGGMRGGRGGRGGERGNAGRGRGAGRGGFNKSGEEGSSQSKSGGESAPPAANA
jgi:hypothetical protein